MSILDHADFIPHDFAAKCFVQSLDVEAGCQQLHYETIRLAYNPANFQHLSLIARMFNPDFVNHSPDGDSSGWASVLQVLPNITFVLPDLQTGVQFVAAPGKSRTCGMAMNVDLLRFVDAAPRGIQIRWGETAMWRLDAEGKIAERWPMPAAT